MWGIEMKYEIGQSASFSKTIAECDVYGFAGITGDFNPLHVNAEQAKNMPFGRRIVHGMLTASFLHETGGQIPEACLPRGYHYGKGGNYRAYGKG